MTKAALKPPEHPGACAPRGLRREAAAAYVGVSATKFDQWVLAGVMPKPKRRDGVVLWDRWALDSAFEELDGAPVGNDWDQAF